MDLQSAKILLLPVKKEIINVIKFCEKILKYVCIHVMCFEDIHININNIGLYSMKFCQLCNKL